MKDLTVKQVVYLSLTRLRYSPNNKKNVTHMADILSTGPLTKYKLRALSNECSLGRGLSRLTFHVRPKVLTKKSIVNVSLVTHFQL